MKAKAKAIFNICSIANDKPFYKIIIESDCKVIVDVILGFNTYPWAISTITDYIKLFLGDYYHIFVV